MANEKKVKLVIDQTLPPQGDNVVKIYGYGDGGGEGGTSDYNELENRPTVNGATLEGNLTLNAGVIPLTGTTPVLPNSIGAKLNDIDADFGTVATSFTEVNTKINTANTKIGQLENKTADVSTGTAGQVLTINAGGNGVEWTTPTGSVPTYGAGDGDKVLGVKTDTSGLEWKTLTGSIPTMSDTDEGKQLTVVKNGSNFEAKWDAPMGDVSIKKGEGDNSIIEGNLNWNEATGTYSHAEGTYTKATANQAHAEGGHTEASGINSHAEGTGTIAASQYQHVQGVYNVKDASNTKFADIVGGGSNDSDRRNIEATSWQGNKYLAGDVYVKCDANSENGKKLEPLPEYTVAEDGKTLKVVKQADNSVKLEWGAGGGGEPDEYLKKMTLAVESKGAMSKHKIENSAGGSHEFWTLTTTATDEGQILAANTDGFPVWQDNIPVPEYATTDKKKVLAVNNGGNNIEWKGYAVPEYSTTDDKEKVLAVKENGTDIEWKKINETPFITLNMGDIYEEETGEDPWADSILFSDFMINYILTNFENGKFYHFINTPEIRGTESGGTKCNYWVTMENTFWELYKEEDTENNVIVCFLTNANTLSVFIQKDMNTDPAEITVEVGQDRKPIATLPDQAGYVLENLVYYNPDGTLRDHEAMWNPKLGGEHGIPNASKQCWHSYQTDVHNLLDTIEQLLRDDTIYYTGEITPITPGQRGNHIVNGSIDLSNGMYLYKLDDPNSRDSGKLSSFNNPKRYLRWTKNQYGDLEWEASEGSDVPAHNGAADAGKLLTVGTDGKLTWVSFDAWTGGTY